MNYKKGSVEMPVAYTKLYQSILNQHCEKLKVHGLVIVSYFRLTLVS